MALQWADGFAHWGDSFAAQQFYTGVNGANIGVLAGPEARTGNWRAYLTPSIYTANSGFYRPVQPSVDKGAGIAFIPAGGLGYPNSRILVFTNGTGLVNQAHVSVGYGNDGSVIVYGGLYAEYARSAPGVIGPGAYSYIECKVIGDTVNGTITVRVNNTVVVQVVGVNTLPAGPTINAVGVYYQGDNNAIVFNGLSDFVIWDTTGGINNDFMGDVRCRTIWPNANGADQDWIATGAAAWDTLDNVPIDGNKYIAASNVGDTSSFGLQHIPTNTAAINGIFIFGAIYKSDNGSCVVQMGVDSGGAVANLPDISPGTGGAYYYGPIQSDPKDGTPWTMPRINALLARYKRSA